jgi:catechol 2,3-dioxygenase-like lactoylglutathione lyase family enzyme
MAAMSRHSPALELSSPSLPGGAGFWWGRVIFYFADVDALYDHALAAGYQPATAPRDAEWGERFFHLTDPDGHELSFARPLLPVSVQ